MLRSSGLGLLGGSSSGYSKHARIAERYAPGTTHTAYVNPDDPLWAVLSTSTWGVFAIMGVLALLPVIGLSLLLWGGGKEATTSIPHQPAPQELPDAPTDPRTRRRVVMLGFLVITIFWNGVLGIIYIGHSATDESMSLFFLPFILVGLFLLGATVYFTLQMFNPVVYLEWQPVHPRIGDTVTIQWRVEGDPTKFDSLKVELEGREVAIYRRGTDTVTARETFYSLQEPCGHTSRLMSQGTLSLEIPSMTMHSFDAEHNKVEWHLRVRGSIPRWPDVSDEYELHVQPVSLV